MIQCGNRDSLALADTLQTCEERRVICFYELKASSLLRFPFWIASKIAEQDNQDREFLLLFSEQDIPIEVVTASFRGFEKVKVEKARMASLDSVQQQLKSSGVGVVIVMAQRIPDMLILVASQGCKIATIMQQHGMYVHFMRRQTSLFVTKLRKSMAYAYWSVLICTAIPGSSFRNVALLFRHFVLGRLLGESTFPNEYVNADTVLVYGEYWKEFHKKQFGYEYMKQRITGSPDFKVGSRNSANNSTVVYVCQTLVEDGRMSRKDMKAFVDAVLLPVAKKYGKSFTIKLHPRSDVSIYRSLSALSVLTKTNAVFGRVVLGHYSSLLCTYALQTESVYIYELPGHRTPFYFKEIAARVFTLADDFDLLGAIGKDLPSPVDEDRVEQNTKYLRAIFGDENVDSLALSALEILSVTDQSAVY